MNNDGQSEKTVSIRQFQALMNTLYGDRDRQRGIDRTYMWFVEEVGELSRSLRKSDGMDHVREEMADILAWLCSIANVLDVDLQDAALSKYPETCPRCRHIPCDCTHRSQPLPV